MRLKELIGKLNIVNDGTRSLLESVAVPEVEEALRDWIFYANEGILIGGCAMSYYSKPRATMDVDVLFLNNSDIPNMVNKFKRIRQGSFQHNNTHVEVEVISPESINIPDNLAKMVYSTATISNGFKIASPSGIVALKLQRLKRNDIGDIVAMIETGKVDLNGWPLSSKNLEDFEEIKTRFV